MANQIVKQTPLCVVVKTSAPTEAKLIVMVFVLMSMGLVLFFKSSSGLFYIFLITIVSINICLIASVAKTTTYIIDRDQGLLTIKKHLLISLVKSYPISTIRKVIQIGVWSSRVFIAQPYLILKSGKRIQLNYWLEPAYINVMNTYIGNS